MECVSAWLNLKITSTWLIRTCLKHFHRMSIFFSRYLKRSAFDSKWYVQRYKSRICTLFYQSWPLFTGSVSISQNLSSRLYQKAITIITWECCFVEIGCHIDNYRRTLHIYINHCAITHINSLTNKIAIYIQV